MNPRLDPVILLSTGRSGSTLLQRYLNCSENLVVWGEHGNLIKGIGRSYLKWSNNTKLQNMLSLGNQHSNLLLSSGTPVGVDIEWTNNFTREDIRKTLARSIADIFSIGIPEQTRWGFKEIRYTYTDMLFLKEFFPESQFIFIVRDPIDTLVSAIAAWSNSNGLWDTTSSDVNTQREKEVRRWSKHIRFRARGFHKSLKEGTGILVKYEELKETPHDILRGIFSFLNMSVPSPEKISLIRQDVRMSRSSESIKANLLNEFSEHESIRKLLKAYKPLGYLLDSPSMLPRGRDEKIPS